MPHEWNSEPLPGGQLVRHTCKVCRAAVTAPPGRPIEHIVQKFATLAECPGYRAPR